MSVLLALRAASSLHDVAMLLNYKPAKLAYILYKLSTASKYKVFQIPKKKGGFRTISAPCTSLMVVQRKLAELLQACIDEIDGAQDVRRPVAHGFKPNLSILTNARVHRGKKYVLNLDLKNFFGEINFGRVRGFFISNRNFGLDKSVATIFAQIACHDNCLPQGSPCSPVISNLIGHVLDVRLVHLAKKYKCSYSRYADDLTFSTNRSDFPSQLAYLESKSDHDWKIGKDLDREIARSGFSVNEEKSRLLYKSSRQEVTGLVTNIRVNTNAHYRGLARAMADSLFKTGVFHLEKSKLSTKPPTFGTINQLKGIFSFIDYIDRQAISCLSADGRWLARTDLYRKLIFFSDFYAAEKPVVLFEGKTDSVYIKCALERLSKDFPSLIGKNKDGLFVFGVRIHKGSRITERFFDLNGGTSGLGKFIREYTDYWSKFRAPINAHPVIIVVDNDDGLGDLKGPLKRYGVTLDSTKDFQWVCHNLYLVYVPGKGNAIEDLFEKSLLAIKLSGKSLNYSNKKLSDKEYGKHYFAEYVVKPRKATIDFSGFSQLLNSIASAISSHYKK